MNLVVMRVSMMGRNEQFGLAAWEWAELCTGSDWMVGTIGLGLGLGVELRLRLGLIVKLELLLSDSVQRLGGDVTHEAK